MIKLAINGFGRIGRLAFRIATLYHRDVAEIVAINTSGAMTASGWMNLVKYDSTYQMYPLSIRAVDLVENPQQEATDEDPLIGYIIANEKKYPVLAQRDPAKLPWHSFGADVIIESTGQFRDTDGARKHLQAGASKVVISAPGKGENITTCVRGVNEAPDDEIISNGSCTTNCISPVMKIMQDEFGIKKALMTTIHSYTDSQRLKDNAHRDLRRGRAAAQNIIPTTTGAAEATTRVVPELAGLFGGMALRVPIPAGALADLVFVTQRPVTVEDVNQTFEEAAQRPEFARILAVTRDPIVSSDVIGQTYSAIVDLNFTQVVEQDLVKILVWYDNEWGYTNRLVEQAIIAGQNEVHSQTQSPVFAHGEGPDRYSPSVLSDNTHLMNSHH